MPCSTVNQQKVSQRTSVGSRARWRCGVAVVLLWPVSSTSATSGWWRGPLLQLLAWVCRTSAHCRRCCCGQWWIIMRLDSRGYTGSISTVLWRTGHDWRVNCGTFRDRTIIDWWTLTMLSTRWRPRVNVVVTLLPVHSTWQLRVVTLYPVHSKRWRSGHSISWRITFVTCLVYRQLFFRWYAGKWVRFVSSPVLIECYAGQQLSSSGIHLVQTDSCAERSSRDRSLFTVCLAVQIIIVHWQLHARLQFIQTRQFHLHMVQQSTDQQKPSLSARLTCITCTHASTHTHTNRLTALCPRLPGWARKSIGILLKQETVSDSGINWAIYKSATRARQITTPAPPPHHWPLVLVK